jgi:hypothetical protein
MIPMQNHHLAPIVDTDYGAASGEMAAGSNSGVTLAALTRALRDEARLLAELTTVVHNQRDGVATDDVQIVDDSVFGAHRILRTIGEARRRRRALLDAIAGSEDLSIHDLEDALGILMTPELRQARDELQAAADILSREIAVNRKIIQEALRAGDGQLRTLCGAPGQQVRYGADARAVDDAQQSGLLLNRQV